MIENGYLRWYLCHLVRTWTALGMIKDIHGNEVFDVFKDLCSDKICNTLHELANKQHWTVGFAEGSGKQQRLFKELEKVNKWFTGGKLHYRNCTGSHMQPLVNAKDAFQIYGFKPPNWKYLTRGVAISIMMMKLIDNNKSSEYWREIRAKVRTEKTSLIPSWFEALIMDYKLDVPKDQ